MRNGAVADSPKPKRRSLLNRLTLHRLASDDNIGSLPGATAANSENEADDAQDKPLSGLKRSNGKPVSFGAIRFLGSKSKPTKFIRMSMDAPPNLVMRLLLETSRMVPPSSLISVVGCGNPPAEVELVLRRGLSEAIRRTNAWLVTSGIVDGVSEQATAAMTMAIKGGADARNLICVGVVNWDAVRGREGIENLENGRVSVYSRPPS